MLLLIVPVIAFSGSSDNYTLTHGNINYVTGHNNSTNYVVDYSVVEQPISNTMSANYITNLGFYFQGMVTYLFRETAWWFLAIVVSVTSMIFLLYAPLKNNEFMKIPVGIGIVLLVLILLNILLVGAELAYSGSQDPRTWEGGVFLSAEALESVRNIVENFYEVVIVLVPFMFTIWLIFFIHYLVKHKINFKNSKI